MRRILVLFITLAAAGCSTGLNYTGLEGPRYAAGPDTTTSPRFTRGDTIQIASFNIKYGIRIDSALVVLHADSMLRRADIVLLQEVDEDGTRRIAHSYGFYWVYYPTERRSNIKRDWGNAVLTRWPIAADEKVILPHIGKFGKTQRIATAVTIRVGETAVRVYSVHLGTIANVTAGGRRDQLDKVLEDAASYPHVIIGGDMNSHGVGSVARGAGYLWPTEHGPKTVTPGRWDHVFLKGLTVPTQYATGTVLDNHHASDHKPIWVRAIIAR